MNVIMDAISPGKMKNKAESNPVPPPRKSQPDVTPRSKPSQKKLQKCMVITKDNTNIKSPIVTTAIQPVQQFQPIAPQITDSNEIDVIQPQSVNLNNPLKSTITVIIPDNNSIISTENDPEPEIIVTETDTSSIEDLIHICLLYTSPSPRDKRQSRMPSSA